MGIPTLISTGTPSDVANFDITSNIDSTYDEYMFVLTDIHASDDGAEFGFQVNAAGASGFNETITSSYFKAHLDEAGDGGALAYVTASDQAQGTAYQDIARNLNNDADASGAGILHLFSPSGTTYVTHFYSRIQNYEFSTPEPYSVDNFASGYINTALAIDEISFKISAGTFSGTIQMFGIA